MVRVLLLCGSLQRVSTNRAALDVAIAALRTKSAEPVEIDDFDGLGAIPPFNFDHVDSPGDAVTDWRARLGAADAVLVAAPEYAGSVAGVVKNAFDWIVGSGELYRKPVSIISAASGGGAQARQTLLQSLTWQGAHVVGTLGIAVPNTKSVVRETDGVRVFTDPPTIAGIEALAASLVAAVGHDATERMAVVTDLVVDAGIDPAHIAPL